jgi:hypothetical protein
MFLPVSAILHSLYFSSFIWYDLFHGSCVDSLRTQFISFFDFPCPVPSIHPSVRLPVSRSNHLPTCQPNHPPTYLPTYLSTNLFTYPHTYSTIHISTHLSTHLSVYLSVCLPTYLPTYIPTYPYTNTRAVKTAYLKFSTCNSHGVFEDNAL